MFRDQREFYIYSLDEYKLFMKKTEQALSNILTDIETKRVLEHFDKFFDGLLQELKSSRNSQIELDEASKLIIRELSMRLNDHTIMLLANHSRQDGKNYDYNKFKGFILYHAHPLKEIHEFVSDYNEIRENNLFIKNTLDQINSILSEYKGDNKKSIVDFVKGNLAQMSKSDKSDPGAVLNSINDGIEFMKDSENEYYSGLTFFVSSRRAGSSLTKIISQMEDCYRSLTQRFPQHSPQEDIASSFHVM